MELNDSCLILGYTNTVALLIQNGAIIEAKEYFNQTALIVAALSGKNENQDQSPEFRTDLLLLHSNRSYRYRTYTFGTRCRL